MKTYLDFMEENSNQFSDKNLLVIVCNVKNSGISVEKYGDFSTDTEFLSNDELNQIMQMAYSQKIPFRVFNGEDSFIRFLTDCNTNINNLIVYNSAQSGTGAGRKALIPSLCNYYNIRHTGSDAYRVSLCRDKYAIAAILSKLSIRVPESTLFHQGRFDSELNPKQKYIAKPIYESASIGIKENNVFFGNNPPLRYLANLENTMNQPLIIQEFIRGYELEVPVLSGKISKFVFPPVVLHRSKKNLFMGDEILDYEKIYNDDYLFSSLPDRINDNEIKQTAYKVANALCLSGLCRVDFRLKEDNTFYVTDVSTNPHFIKHSSVNYAFKKSGLTDAQLFDTILKLS